MQLLQISGRERGILFRRFKHRKVNTWIDRIHCTWYIGGKYNSGRCARAKLRINEEAKPEVMRDLARQLMSEAREAVESAARCGEQPPPWVQAFMSPAGWERYQQLREEAGRSDQAITTSSEPAPHTRGVGGSCQTSAQAVPSSKPAPGAIETFAAELGATIGEPCEKCGCALYRHMAEYQVCLRCYPPRGYHVYSDRIDALYPTDT